MTTTLTYYPADSTEPRQTPTSTTAQVQALADRLLDAYRAAGGNRPGLELTRGDPEDGGESISLAVADIGWAMVHTDADFNQRCTRNAASAEEGSIDVDWGQITPIPKKWFLPVTMALPALNRWLTDGDLDIDVFSCTDCS
jgi:hypothetical protein